jgi:hypothetical protein
MTTEEQDAVLGRLMRERQALQARRAALGAEGERICEIVVGLGKAMRNLSRVALNTEVLAEEFDSPTNPAYRISSLELDEICKILPLAREYRETIGKLRLNQEFLADAGWKT